MSEEKKEKADAPAGAPASSEPHAAVPKGEVSVMGVLAYIGPLVLVPYLTAQHDPFVKFHTRQGLTLFGVEIVVWVLSMMFWFLAPLIMLIQLVIFIFAIVGIVNVVKKKQAPLPIIGGFADNLGI